jgi:hypothetical protein
VGASQKIRTVELDGKVIKLQIVRPLFQSHAVSQREEAVEKDAVM